MTDPAVVCAIVVDCEDAPLVARFWLTMLGGRIVSYPELGVEALRAPGITFDFVSSGERKATKNRWHLDLATDDPDETVAVAVAAGATRVDHGAASDGFLSARSATAFCASQRTLAGRALSVLSS